MQEGGPGGPAAQMVVNQPNESGMMDGMDPQQMMEGAANQIDEEDEEMDDDGEGRLHDGQDEMDDEDHR